MVAHCWTITKIIYVNYIWSKTERESKKEREGIIISRSQILSRAALSNQLMLIQDGTRKSTKERGNYYLQISLLISRVHYVAQCWTIMMTFEYMPSNSCFYHWRRMKVKAWTPSMAQLLLLLLWLIALVEWKLSWIF